jgi:hypothetical protein
MTPGRLAVDNPDWLHPRKRAMVELLELELVDCSNAFSTCGINSTVPHNAASVARYPWPECNGDETTAEFGKDFVRNIESVPVGPIAREEMIATANASCRGPFNPSGNQRKR